jgi:hypothetical protein
MSGDAVAILMQAIVITLAIFVGLTLVVFVSKKDFSFLRSGLFTNLETFSLRGLPRPEDDKYAGQFPLSDPVFAVWGERQ